MTRRRLLILGLRHFGQLLADQLTALGWDATYEARPGQDPRAWLRLAPQVARADLLYLVGGRIDRWTLQDMLVWLGRKPVVMHWVGTDVLRAAIAHRSATLSTRIRDRVIHWCDAPWLGEELRAFGIPCEYSPLPVPIWTGSPLPLPPEFRVLLYLPADARDRRVFDEETILRLPSAFPHVPFTLLPATPGALSQALPPNVESPGWVRDMHAVYVNTSVLIRLTRHDGMSFMAVEALSRARHVIWTCPLTGAIQASGFTAVHAELSGLLSQHAAGRLQPNRAGRAYVLEAFDPHRLLSQLDRRLRQVIDPTSR